MTDRPSSSNGGAVREPVDIDPRVPHASRVYDYLVGGDDHFEADRRTAEFMTKDLPGGIDSARRNARTNRVFLGQAVRWLASEAGIRQYLDVGPGIPTVQQTHEVAQAVAPGARIVYIDNDPMVLAHAHTLLESTPQGATAFLQGDLRNPDQILTMAADTLDFSQPIALMLVAIYHMIPDTDHPLEIHARLVDALPPDSYVVLSHLTADFTDEMTESVDRLSARTRERFVNRSKAEFDRFLDGLELVEPGVAQIDDWLRHGPLPPPADVLPAMPQDPAHEDWVNPLWAAIGRKP